MTALLAVVWVAFVVLFSGFALAALRRFEDHSSTMRDIYGVLESIKDGPEVPFERRLTVLEELVDMLPLKWEEIQRTALGAEARARAHIKRVQKELASLGLEDPGLDRAASELRTIDDNGGEEESVRLVPGGVEADISPPDRTDPPPHEDWLDLALAAKWGA